MIYTEKADWIKALITHVIYINWQLRNISKCTIYSELPSNISTMGMIKFNTIITSEWYYEKDYDNFTLLITMVFIINGNSEIGRSNYNRW